MLDLWHTAVDEDSGRTFFALCRTGSTAGSCRQGGRGRHEPGRGGARVSPGAGHGEPVVSFARQARSPRAEGEEARSPARVAPGAARGGPDGAVDRRSLSGPVAFALRAVDPGGRPASPEAGVRLGGLCVDGGALLGTLG